MITHQPYPSDVSDAEPAFVVPYLCLLPEDAGQRVSNLRDVFDALRWIVRAGSQWRYLPKDFPPWQMVYQQSRRWLAAFLAADSVVDRRRLHCRLNSLREPGRFPCLIRRRRGVRLCLMARRTFLGGT